MEKELKERKTGLISMSKIGGVILVLAVLVLLLIRLQARRKRIKEEKFQAMKKMRESSLKEALSNNLEEKAEGSSATPYRPYKVEYATGENQDSKERRPLLQIVEKNKLAEKKYIFRSNDVVILGIQFGAVAILNHLENAEVWCELFFQDGVYCIRSCEKGSVSVWRNRKAAIVDRVGLQLKSGDMIQLQETTFQVFYIKG